MLDWMSPEQEWLSRMTDCQRNLVHISSFYSVLGPMIFVITGDGNVSRGALHIAKCLPHEWVKPGDLKKLAESKDFDNHKVYLCQVEAKDYCVDRHGKFDLQRYYTHPEEYTSNFHEKVSFL
jgi:alpha-aminoadipic semialdehyde synthase